MKKLSSVFGLLALVATIATACVDEDPNYNKGGNPADRTIGYLALGNIDLNVVMDTDQTTDRNLSSTRADNQNCGVGDEAATVDDYMVEILPVEGGTAVYTGKYKELRDRIETERLSNNMGMALPVGTYTIKAWSNKREDRMPQLIQSTPSYMGSTPADKPLRIVAEKVAEPVKVTCTLVNIKVTVEIEESLRKNYAGESILDIQEAWVALGDTKFIYKDADGWDNLGISGERGFEFEDQTKPVYFRAVNTENMLQFHFKATPKGGNAVTLNKNIPNVKGGHWRKIKIVGKHDTQGNLTFDVQVSTLVQDETIHAGDDVNTPGTSSWAEDTMADPEDAAGAPKVEWQGGDVNADIVVGASNPSANDVTIRTTNKIASIALDVTTTNSEFDYDAKMMTVADLCQVTGSRMLSEYGIPFGSGLVGKEELSFSLDKIMNKIRPYNGRYVFTLTITDQRGFTTTQALTFVVGDAPVGNNDPTIVGDGFNLEERQNMDNYMESGISLIISAPNKIEQLNVSINSDNTSFMDEVGALLPPTFDLCHITDTSAQWVGLLQQGGFPINEEVLGADSVTFTINSFFMTLLQSFVGNHDFTVNVVDATGASTTATLKLLKE